MNTTPQEIMKLALAQRMAYFFNQLIILTLQKKYLNLLLVVETISQGKYLEIIQRKLKGNTS